MTLQDWARVLLRAADIAEQDLETAGHYSYAELAASRQLRWLSDGANEIADEDANAVRIISALDAINAEAERNGPPTTR